MKTQDLLTDLMGLEAQLEGLPNEVALSSRARARLRTQVMAHAYKGRPAAVSLWGRIGEAFGSAFSPRILTRPAGAALSVVAAVALAGTTTVSAAMESLPGDGLYAVKTAYERSCLVLAGNEESQAQCHLWMASSRVNEIERAADAGRLDAIEKSFESYGVSVGVALTLAASSKQPEKVHEQLDAVQTSLKEVYAKAPDAVRPLLPIALATNAPVSGGIKASTSNTETNTPPVTENHAVPPPAEPGFVDAAPAVAGAPGSSTWIQDKTGATAEPASGKDLPISTPPVAAQPIDPSPVKNAPGPATAPLPTKNDTTTAVEPEKSGSEAVAPSPLPSKDAPSASESPVPSKEQIPAPAPAPEGKPSIIIQGQGFQFR